MLSCNTNDTDVDAWVAAVVAAGASVSAATKRAAVRLVKRLKDQGVWSKLHRINLFAGSSLTAALVPLKASFGNASDTNNNFVSGDFTEVGTGGASGGLNNGTGNTTKYLTTGYNPNTAGCTYQDFHLAVYMLDDTSTNANGNSSRFFGSDDAGGAGGAPIVNLYGAQQSGFSTAGAAGGFTAALVKAGYFAFSSQGGNLWVWDGLIHQVRSSSSTPPNVGSLNYNINVFAAGSTNKVGSGRVGAYSMGLGLTQAQSFTLGQAMEDFNRDLSRIDTRPVCAAFGDSITRGFGLTVATQRWSYKVAVNNGLKEMSFAQDFRRLRADFPTTPFTRGGINAYTDLITYLKPVRPARVYIMLGTNDCFDDPDNTNGTTSIANDFESKLETCIQYFLDAGVPAAGIVVGSPPIGTVAQLSSATKMGLYVAACALAASNKGVKYADIWTETNNAGGGQLQGDGIHLSASGHVTAAATFTSAN